MDPQRFDRLARSLSARTAESTRRGMLRRLLALPLAGGIAPLLGAEPEAAAQTRGKPRSKRQQRQRNPKTNDRRSTRGEACIPTGKKCPSKKPRGKKRKKLGCNRCCQGVAMANGRGKRVCGCVPVGESCTSGGTAVCCSGVCDGTTCQSGAPPAPTCTAHSQCGVNALCLDDGTCQPCTVTCPNGETPEACGAALQAALDDSAEGGAVYACPGLYRGGFTIASGVSLIGAGEDDDPLIDTILDADGTGHVVLVFGVAVDVTLRRLHITNGLQFGGAGIRHAGGTLLMSDCTVAGNTAEAGNSGAGIWNEQNRTLEMTRCTVRDNHVSGGHGGGIRNDGTLTLTDCLIELNTAQLGGGIRNNGGATTLAGATEVRDNEAADVGGGFYIFSGTLEIGPDCEVTLNTADPGQGGGIFATDPDAVTLANAQIVTNNTGGNCEPEGQIDNCVG